MQIEAQVLMALYFIGLGLADPEDITVKGLEIVKKSSKVFLEHYTSILQCDVAELSTFYGKEVIVCDRDVVEKDADRILADAKDQDVSFLVVGDPFGATTHVDLKLRAAEKKIDVHVIHNASILNALGEVGLELYKFGKTTSIPFDTTNVNAPVDVYSMNQKNGLHTLFLLDLDPPSGKFMQGSAAVHYLLSKGIEGNKKGVIVCALGSSKQKIVYGTLEDLKDLTIDAVPQCLILPGNLHFMEEDALELYTK